MNQRNNKMYVQKYKKQREDNKKNEEILKKQRELMEKWVIKVKR